MAGGEKGSAEQPANIRADLKDFVAGQSALTRFIEDTPDPTSARFVEVVGSILLCMWNTREFNPDGKRASFSIADGVTWIVRELKLLEKSNKYDVEAAENAKLIALRVLEGARSLNFIEPKGKLAGRIQGTLKMAGFQGMSMRSEDRSVWLIDKEEMEKHGAKFPV